jgi:hypothetical protein
MLRDPERAKRAIAETRRFIDVGITAAHFVGSFFFPSMILGFRSAPPQALRFRPHRGLRQNQNSINLIRGFFSLSKGCDQLNVRQALACRDASTN